MAATEQANTHTDYHTLELDLHHGVGVIAPLDKRQLLRVFYLSGNQSL